MARVVPRRRPRTLLFAAPALAWAGVLFWLSAQPASKFEDAGLSAALAGIPGRDYLVHAGLYFVLGGLVWLWALLGLGTTRGLALIVAVSLAVLYGVSDEWHQSFVPGRTPDAKDVLADGVGALAAGVSLWVANVLWIKGFKSSSGGPDAGR